MDNSTSDNSKGCVLEVEPEYLKELHNDYSSIQIGGIKAFYPKNSDKKN